MRPSLAFSNATTLIVVALALGLPVALAGIGQQWMRGEGTVWPVVFNSYLYWPMFVAFVVFSITRFVIEPKSRVWTFWTFVIGYIGALLLMWPALALLYIAAHIRFSEAIQSIVVSLAFVLVWMPATVVEVIRRLQEGGSRWVPSVYILSAALFTVTSLTGVKLNATSSENWYDSALVAVAGFPYLLYFAIRSQRIVIWHPAIAMGLSLFFVWGIVAVGTLAAGRPLKRAVAWPYIFIANHVPLSVRREYWRNPENREPVGRPYMLNGRNYDFPLQWQKTRLNGGRGDMPFYIIAVSVPISELLPNIKCPPTSRRDLCEVLRLSVIRPAPFDDNVERFFCAGGYFGRPKNSCLMEWPYRDVRLSVNIPRELKSRAGEIRNSIEGIVAAARGD